MYGRLAAAFGWTWEYIDNDVTIPILLETAEYFAHVPPLAESVAALRYSFTGETPPRQDSTTHEPADHGDLIAELAQMGVPIPL